MKPINILKFIVLLAICHIAAFMTLQDSLLLYLVVAFIFAVPIVCFSSAQTTLIKETKLRHLSSNTIIYNFASKRFFVFIFHFITGTILSFIIPIFIITFSVAEYFSCIITLLLIFISRFFILKIAPKVYKEKYLEVNAQTLTNNAIVAVGIIFFSLFIYIFSDFSQTPLFDYKNFQSNKIAFAIGSIINNSNQVITAILNNDFSQQLPIPFHLILAVLLLRGGILFFALTRFFLFFFLDSTRLKSVFAPLSESDTKHAQPLFVAIFFISLIFTFSSIAFALHSFCSDSQKVKFIDDKTVLITEKISDNIYKIGTVASLEKLEQEFNAETKEELAVLVNEYFNQMIAKTDDYLDWYYSLSREYSELLTFITGIASNKLEEKTQEFINKNLEEKLSLDYNLNDKLYSAYNSLYQKFDDAKKTLLTKNSVKHTNAFHHIVIHTTADKIYKIKKPKPIINTNTQAAVAITSGVGSAIASKIITQKLLKKLSAKIASKTVTSAASKKLATSVAAVIGTAAGPLGTILGTGIGFGVGIITDKLIINADEAINREKYKADIISCIEEERLFYLQQIKSNNE